MAAAHTATIVAEKSTETLNNSNIITTGQMKHKQMSKGSRERSDVMPRNRGSGRGQSLPFIGSEGTQDSHKLTLPGV